MYTKAPPQIALIADRNARNLGIVAVERRIDQHAFDTLAFAAYSIQAVVERTGGHRHVDKVVLPHNVRVDILIGQIDIEQAVRREIPFIRSAVIGGTVGLQVRIAAVTAEMVRSVGAEAIEAVLHLT